MFILGFFLGVLISGGTGFWGYKLFRKITKKFGPQWYDVSDFSTQAEADGIYLMNFYLQDKSICRGYTKKCPPQNIQANELEVKIRSFHPQRKKYRVFWQMKPSLS